MGKRFLFALGRPFSPLYGWTMQLREAGYRRGIFRVHGFPVPVISVGNLTLGGTGKTPLVQHLCRFLLDHGRRPAVISRGYGGATREPVNVVSDGKDVRLSALNVGDEPRLLAETLPGVMVLTGVVRRLPAARAVEMGADVLILDDGFQHLAVARNLDLVLFSADHLAGNSRIFPGGDLREPVRALRRADAFVLTGITPDNGQRCRRFADLLRERFPGTPVFSTSYETQGFVRRTDDQGLELVRLDPRREKIYAFCGIARPESFRSTLTGMEIVPLAFEALPDHHRYRETEQRRLARAAARAGATLILTTEKDLVKLDPSLFTLPLVAPRRGVCSDGRLESLVRSRIRDFAKK